MNGRANKGAVAEAGGVPVVQELLEAEAGPAVEEIQELPIAPVEEGSSTRALQQGLDLSNSTRAHFEQRVPDLIHDSAEKTQQLEDSKALNAHLSAIVSKQRTVLENYVRQIPPMASYMSTDTIV